jgi:hypothetical protein
VSSITIKKSLAFLLLAFGILLIVSNVLLARRIAQMRKIDDQLNASNKLEPGSAVPPLIGYDVAGNKLTYDYGTDPRDTVLLVFSPGCHACDENWPNWTRLIKGLNSQSTRLVIANVASGLPVTSEYIARHEIGGVPLIAEVSPESMQAYRMIYTPQTILVGRDGKVRKVQTGAFSDKVFALESNCSQAADGHCLDNASTSAASAAASVLR